MNSLTTIPQSIALTITPRGHPLVGGGLTSFQRSGGCILQPQPTGQQNVRGHINEKEKKNLSSSGVIMKEREKLDKYLNLSKKL